jgi:hypothetical protein
MVRVRLFDKLFEIDLGSPARPARWWFVDGWVDHALTNEEVLFNPGASRSSEELAAAVEAFGMAHDPVPAGPGKVPAAWGPNDP